MKEIKQYLIYVGLAAIGLTLLLIFGSLIKLGIFYIKNADGKVDIVNRDGIAYIEYTDKTCKLLDSNGKQIPYTNTIKSEHKLSVASSDIGNTTVIVVYDESTGKYYIAMNDWQSEDITQTLSIMYDKDNLEKR